MACKLEEASESLPAKIILQYPQQDRAEKPHEQQNSPARVYDWEPVDPQLVRQHRRQQKPVHPTRKGRARPLPLHRVQELHFGVLILRNVDHSVDGSVSIDLDHSVVVVQNGEPNVAVQKVLVISRIGLAVLVDFTDESPDGQVIEVHLKVVVIADCIPELCDVFFRQLLSAHRLWFYIYVKVDLVRRIDEAVAVQNFT